MSRISIVLVASYLLFCGANRFMARQVLAAESAGWSERPEFSYVFPEPLGPHRWRGVIRAGNTYHVYLIHPLSNRIERVSNEQTERGRPAVEHVRATAKGRRLEWFFKAPVWRVEESPSAGDSSDDPSAVVTVYDLRFRSAVIHRGTPFVYRFRVRADGRVETP